jgi:hypothetical protein
VDGLDLYGNLILPDGPERLEPARREELAHLDVVHLPATAEPLRPDTTTVGDARAQPQRHDRTVPARPLLVAPALHRTGCTTTSITRHTGAISGVAAS